MHSLLSTVSIKPLFATNPVNILCYYTTDLRTFSTIWIIDWGLIAGVLGYIGVNPLLYHSVYLENLSRISFEVYFYCMPFHKNHWHMFKMTKNQFLRNELILKLKHLCAFFTVCKSMLNSKELNLKGECPKCSNCYKKKLSR